MGTYWDAFIEKYSYMLADKSLREMLKLFYLYLREQGVTND